MATAYTAADSLGVYLTGAYGNVSNYSADNSIGGVRLGVREVTMQGLYYTPIPPLRIDEIIGPTAGDGIISSVSSGSVAYTAPGDTIGATVAIANGETKYLPSGTVTGGVRVTRESADALSRYMTLRIKPPYNNVIGMDNVTSAEAAAGLNTYRGLIIRNDGSLGITNLKAYLKVLGSTRTSDSAQLGASGSGTITTTGSFDSGTWPESGWCRIVTSGGTLREIVYYSARTDTSLTVPAAGRARLGTTAAAGAATDNLFPVPGIRITQATLTSGALERLTNEATAPTGPTWSTTLTVGSGIQFGTAGALAAGATDGLFIHREIPAGAVAAAQLKSLIGFSWTYDGVAYTRDFPGYYRIGNAAYDIYELYVGEDAAPDVTAAPADTDTAMPLTKAVASPVAGTKDINVTVRRRNQYNLVSQNVYYQTITINSSGQEVVTDVSAPHDVTATETSSGMVLLTATYDHYLDDEPADTWRIYAFYAGVDPVPGVDTPTAEVTMIPFGLRSDVRKLIYKLGPYDQGTYLRIIVTAYRSEVDNEAESTNTTVTNVTVSTTTPATPRARGVQLGGRHYLPISKTLDTTTYTDQGNNIYFRLTPGNAWFYAGTTLIWRVIYDGSGLQNNRIYINGAFDVYADAVTGTGTDDAVETAAWNGTKTLYVNVNEQRRMLLGVTVTDIKAANFYTTEIDHAEVREVAARMGNRYTTFYVYDPYSADWFMYGELSILGAFKTTLDMDNTLSQAAIEAL